MRKRSERFPVFSLRVHRQRHIARSLPRLASHAQYSAIVETSVKHIISGEMAGAKVTRNPSPYRPLPFHLLRLGQSISAIIVSSVVCFFVYYLLREHYKLPWTFIFVRPSLPPPSSHKSCMILKASLISSSPPPSPPSSPSSSPAPSTSSVPFHRNTTSSTTPPSPCSGS